MGECLSVLIVMIAFFIVLIAKIETILTELPNIDIDPFMLTMGLIAACKPT